MKNLKQALRPVYREFCAINKEEGEKMKIEEGEKMKNDGYYVHILPGEKPKVCPVPSDVLAMMDRWVHREEKKDNFITKYTWIAPAYYLTELGGRVDYNRETPMGKCYGPVNIYAASAEISDDPHSTRVVPMSMHDAEHICSCIDDDYIHTEDF